MFWTLCIKRGTLEENMTICEQTGKICYSEKEAGRAINHSKKHRYRKSHYKKKIVKRKYWCEFCNTWHLTSMSYFSRDLQEKYKKSYNLLMQILLKKLKGWFFDSSVISITTDFISIYFVFRLEKFKDKNKVKIVSAF